MLDTVVRVYNPSTQEAEAQKAEKFRQSGIHSCRAAWFTSEKCLRKRNNKSISYVWCVRGWAEGGKDSDRDTQRKQKQRQRWYLRVEGNVLVCIAITTIPWLFPVQHCRFLVSWMMSEAGPKMCTDSAIHELISVAAPSQHLILKPAQNGLAGCHNHTHWNSSWNNSVCLCCGIHYTSMSKHSVRRKS